MASTVYNNFKEQLLNGTFNLTSDTVKVALVASSYTPNIDSHTAYSDLTNEVSGTGYSAGGATLGSQTVTQDNTNDRGVFDGADTSWTTSTITARAAVLYDSTASKLLICYVDFGSDYTTVAGTLAITWSSSGILYLG